MKVDIKEIAGGVMNTLSIRKLIRELSIETNNEPTKELHIISEGTEARVLPTNLTNTRLLFEIIEILRNIDANVEKIVNSAK
jgi:hypothetical protein